MARPPLIPTHAVVSKSETQASAGVSRTSIALTNETVKKIVNLKESLIRDVAHSTDITRDDLMTTVMKIQSFQKDIVAIKGSILPNGELPNFTQTDVEHMGKMKREGKTEQEIADLYETNQTKVNRLLNSK